MLGSVQVQAPQLRVCLVPNNQLLESNALVVDEIIRKVRQILNLLSNNVNADFSVLDNEIDSLFFEMYDLNCSERLFINNNY